MANEKENDQVRERLGKQKERTPGEIVAVCRKKKGWNQEELAYRCGISVSQLSRIERNLSRPSFETIEKLEDNLGVELLDTFRRFRKHVNPYQRGYLSPRDALESFERQLAHRKIPEETLNRILNEALQAVEAEGDVTTGDNDAEGEQGDMK